MTYLALPSAYPSGSIGALQAVIEEARRHARRRRRKNAAYAVLAVGAGMAVFLGFGQRGSSTRGSAASARPLAAITAMGTGDVVVITMRGHVASARTLHEAGGTVHYRETGSYRIVWRVPASALRRGRVFRSTSATVTGVTSAAFANAPGRSCTGTLTARRTPFVLRTTPAYPSYPSTIGLSASPSPIATAISPTCHAGQHASVWRLTNAQRRQKWWVYNHPGGSFYVDDLRPLPKGGGSEGWIQGWGQSGSFRWLAAFSLHRARAAPQPIVFPASDGKRIKGEIIGSGPVGIVVAHDADSNLTAWRPAARLLSQHGYRVLLFGYRRSPWDSQYGTHPAGTFRYDRDMAGAAAYLHRLGATKIVLAGDGIGGLVALVTAHELGTEIAAVFTLTAGSIKGTTDSLGDPSQPDDLDALAAVRHLRTPILFLAGPGDTNARPLFQTATSSDRHLYKLPTAAFRHDGFGMSTWTQKKEWARNARSEILSFIGAHTQPR